MGLVVRCEMGTMALEGCRVCRFKSAHSHTDLYASRNLQLRDLDGRGRMLGVRGL